MRSHHMPDLSERPSQITCEKFINSSPERIFACWTTQFDHWFAQPGTLQFTAEVDKPYFFYNRNDWGRHPHYGRVLEVEENRLIEMTWITGNGTPEGTAGAETVLRIELIPQDDGTQVRLTHSGFVDQKSSSGHKENWPLALDILADTVTT